MHLTTIVKRAPLARGCAPTSLGGNLLEAAGRRILRSMDAGEKKIDRR
jgi:hypothetical protein